MQYAIFIYTYRIMELPRLENTPKIIKPKNGYDDLGTCVKLER